MAKEVYIDSNGNEIPINSAPTYASQMPLSPTDDTDTASAIEDAKDSALKIANVHSLKGVTNITSATAITYTGVSISIPANSFYSVSASAIYGANSPSQLVISGSSTSHLNSPYGSSESGVHKTVTMSGYTESAITLYVWAKYNAVGSNRIDTDGFYIKLE